MKKSASPLAEGRELKLNVMWQCSTSTMLSPLAEGRELKYVGKDTVCDIILSPLAEGRELK